MSLDLIRLRRRGRSSLESTKMTTSGTEPVATPEIMYLVRGFVLCAHHGTVHDDVPNPYNEPCSSPYIAHSPRRCVEDQSGNHYRCPGPHRFLYVEKELPT